MIGGRGCGLGAVKSAWVGSEVRGAGGSHEGRVVQEGFGGEGSAGWERD